MKKMFAVFCLMSLSLSAFAVDQKTSNTGAIFVRDTSIPALGEAYRDPKGVIWGSVWMTTWMNQVIPRRPSLDEARQYCSKIKLADGKTAHLPTADDFARLAKYLGDGSPKGYSPFSADGKTPVLADLDKQDYWFLTDTTTSDSDGDFGVKLFNGALNSFIAQSVYRITNPSQGEQGEPIVARCVLKP